MLSAGNAARPGPVFLGVCETGRGCTGGSHGEVFPLRLFCTCHPKACALGFLAAMSPGNKTALEEEEASKTVEGIQKVVLIGNSFPYISVRLHSWSAPTG